MDWFKLIFFTILIIMIFHLCVIITKTTSEISETLDNIYINSNTEIEYLSDIKRQTIFIRQAVENCDYKDEMNSKDDNSGQYDFRCKSYNKQTLDVKKEFENLVKKLLDNGVKFKSEFDGKKYKIEIEAW